MLTKEKANQLKSLEGECRGVAFKLDGEYVLKTRGEEGLKKLEDKLTSLGSPINYQEIQSMQFYPIGLRVISLLAARDVFGLEDKEIEAMGAEAPKRSIVIKLFLKYFLSIPAVLKQVSQMWEKHYTKGKMEAISSDEKSKEIVVRLSQIDLDPIFCCYLKGYLKTISKMVIARDNISIKETTCVFSGGKYHEFLITW